MRLTPLEASNRPAFEALLAQAWRQNWDPELARALLRWRYDDRPSGGAALLACKDGQCVATLDSFLRPYLLDGRRILVREGCDWFCLPKYRPLGLGVRLMKAMMARPEPMIAIGGSDATREILPRLGWTKLPDGQKYVLPITARGLAGAVLRSRWPTRESYARAIPGFLALRRPRPTPAPPRGLVAECGPGPPPLLPLAAGRGLVQQLEQADHDWIVQIPQAVAQPLGIEFLQDDKPIGFSLSQIEPSACGLEGCILHLQIADPAQAVMDWMVAETAARLAARGAGIIRCLATCPEKATALHKAGFVARETVPCYWWSNGDLPAPKTLDAGYLRADDALPLAALHGRHIRGSQRRPPAFPAGASR